MIRCSVAVSVVLFLTGCSFNSPYIAVVHGNYSYDRGDYQQAVVKYLEARESGEHTEWISYNMGNVYHSLGEISAALQLWEEAEASGETELRFAISFNRGVLHYQQGRYREAYDSFKAALVLNNRSLEAKRNLELSLLKIQAGGNLDRTQPAGDTLQTQDRELDADSARVLEYVRRKEGNRWTATGESPEETVEKFW
jgi:tetratricopeptide (TPR) repeat protein